ncbi:MAG TPA: histidine triad nucleotide-binding protein [Ktedonobacterales bacterium]|jgi:histidine triad (HIT) family protein|nr:histidine triad nucleotide-binding protein [Ktedonobacterales bacterium]
MAEDTQADCLFCRIVAGEIPSNAVYDDGVVYAFRDINPGAPTHALIVPKRHIRDIAAPEAMDGALLVALTRAANTIAQREGIAESGYRLVWNVGPDAGQSVFHLHLHLLGGRPMAWPPG